jgi:zinc transport system substrate-binding protein
MRRVRTVARAASVAAVACVLAAGCGSGLGAGAEDGKPRVVTSFYPLEFLARQVGGPDVKVENLTKPGTEPHDLELNPRQVAGLAEADLVVYLKGLQPAVDEAVAQNHPKAALDVTTVVPLEDRGSESQPAGSAGEEGHGADPHIWLDPARFAALVQPVADKLASADADQAAGYRSRAGDLTARLRTLDAEYKTGLSHCQRHDLVTSHSAFGYLAERYGLRQVGISGLSPEAEPSPARLAAVQDIVKAKGVTTVFFETLVSPKTAQTLAHDAGVKAEVLDPLEGVADASREDYLSVMRTNLTTLRSALGCS